MISRFLALCVVLVLAGTAQAQTYKSNAFAANTRGLTLRELVGSTLVGVTRESSKVWSLYLGRDKKAEFRFSSGTKDTATYRFRAKNIICFKGLKNMKSGEELCKLAKPLGLGLDWRSVKITRSTSETLYFDYIDKAAKNGSSQIVYRYYGKQQVSHAHPKSNVNDWTQKVIIGRTLASKKVWIMQLLPGNKVELVHDAGRKLKGTYEIKNSRICLKFNASPSRSGCKYIRVGDSKLLWQKSTGGAAQSEIVYVSPRFNPPPPAQPKDGLVALRVAKPTFDIIEVAAGGHMAAGMTSLGGMFLFNARTDADYRNGQTLSIETPTGHTETKSIALSEDGTVIAHAGKGTVGLMRLSAKAYDYFQVDSGNGRGFAVKQMALTQDGSRLLAADADGVLVQYDTTTQKRMWVQNSMAMPLAKIAYLPDGKRFVTATTSGFLKLHDADTGAEIGLGALYGSDDVVPDVKNIIWTSDIAAAPDGKSFAVGTFGGLLAVVDIKGDYLKVRYRKTYKGVQDMDILQQQGQALIALALKDQPARLLEYSSGSPFVLFGPKSASIHEIDLMDPAKLIFLTAESKKKGLPIWVVDEVAKAEALGMKKKGAATASQWQAKVKETLAMGAEKRGDALKSAQVLYDAGECVALNAQFNSWYVLSIANDNGNRTCAQNVEKDQDEATRAQVLEHMKEGRCRAIGPLLRDAQDLTPEQKAETVEACDGLWALKSVFEQIDGFKVTGECEPISDLLIERRDTLRFLGRNWKPVEDRQFDRLVEEAVSTCREDYIFDHAPAIEMYLSAVEKEADGEPAKAQDIYKQLMSRHPSDPIALKAADRLIELVDRTPKGIKPSKSTRDGPRNFGAFNLFGNIRLPEASGQ